MNTIITIGREYGSAGHEIGEKIANYFNIPFCDKEILKRAAKDSGFCEEIIQNHDERPTSSFLYNLVMDSYSFGNYSSSYVDMPISNKVFLAQFEAIKSMAAEGPCVFVGRCADYALADFDNVINIFIYADEAFKIKYIREHDPSITSDNKARELFIKKDKSRQAYYNYYSSKKWGHAGTYDLCVNSAKLGIDKTVKLITQYIEDFEKKM